MKRIYWRIGAVLEKTSRSRRSRRLTRPASRAGVDVVTVVTVLRPYVLSLEFADGTARTVDIEPFLQGEIFQPLLDPAVFEAAAVDPVLGTVVWPNGADFSPEFLRHARLRSASSPRKR